VSTALLNGVAIVFAEGTTVAEVVAANCPSDRGVAVALDLEVVPRSQWSDVVVPDGAALEIVTAAPGG
jgi:sulfur carrier protein